MLTKLGVVGVRIAEKVTRGSRDTAAGTFDGRVSGPTSKPSYLQDDLSLGEVFKGVYPFLAALVAAVIILFLLPQLITFLPSIASY